LEIIEASEFFFVAASKGHETQKSKIAMGWRSCSKYDPAGYHL
jgi:hypothetical protein